jgi:hypothetical protein
MYYNGFSGSKQTHPTVRPTALRRVMPQKIRVKRCCHGPADEPRFVADIGDTVLIREGASFLEAVIVSIPSADEVVVRDESTGSSDKAFPTSAIDTLMLGD